MSEKGLRNILAYAKKHPEDTVQKRRKNTGPPDKVSLYTIRKRWKRHPLLNNYVKYM